MIIKYIRKVVYLTFLLLAFTACGSDNTTSKSLMVDNNIGSVQQSKQDRAVTRKISVTFESKIAGLYIAYFGRAPDLEGLKFWKDRATKFESEKVLKELSAGFAKHPTFVSTYKGMSNRAFVKAIYKNVLGKAGDEEGVVYWTKYLDGGKSRSDMVAKFVEISLTEEVTAENFPNLTHRQLATAQERQDYITNKVKVALSFTTLLGARTNVANPQHPENDPAYKASIKILSDVTADNASVSSAIDFLNGIKGDDDPIDRINNPTPTLTPTPTPTINNTIPITPPIIVKSKKVVLIDSVVAGVRFQCGTKVGVTDENGTFECSEFPAIFTVADGELEIGRINAMPSDLKVFIQDLVGVARDNFTDPRVLKIAKLLQSLDDDGDYDTAINIDDSGIALAEAKKIDDLNISEVEKILMDSGLTVVSDEDVIYHLIENASIEVNQTIAKDKYDVSVDKENLTFPESLEPTEPLVLPNVGAKGSQYSYDFTDEENTLLLNRPSFSDKNRTIMIRATITKGTVSDTKNSPLILIHQPITDLEAVTLAKDKLNIVGVLSAIDGDVVLETSGEYGVSISWESNSDAISASGVVTRPSFSAGNQVVQLRATITKGSESVTKVFEVTVLKLSITDAESVANVKDALDLGDTSNLTENLILPTNIDGVTITWSSSGDAISDSGVINPDNYAGIDKTATLTATLTKGAVSDTKEFEVTVPKLPITDAQKVAVDKGEINIGLFW